MKYRKTIIFVLGFWLIIWGYKFWDEDLKYIGDRTTYEETVRAIYPSNKIFQEAQIGCFVRIDSIGNVYSFQVFSIPDKKIYLEKFLFKVKP
jgi:hypothetical protein